MSGHKTQEGLDLDQIADYEVLGYLVVFALQAAFFFCISTFFENEANPPNTHNSCMLSVKKILPIGLHLRVLSL